MKLLARIFFVIAVFSTVIHSQHAHHDPPEPETSESKKTELIDEFGRLSHCDQTSRFDTFFAQLSQQPDSIGYVLIYQGADVLPAYYDVPVMERVFRNHMAFRNFDASRVEVISGGFRNEGITQLWIAPPGGEVPEPSDTIEAPTIPSDKTFLYDETEVELAQSADGLTGFELPSVKAEHEAALAEMKAEEERENPDADEQAMEEVETDGPQTNERQAEEVEAPAEIEAIVDTRTAEEVEADRFSWISERYGELLAKRENSTGVIIFYSDDQTLDIARVMDFVEEGKWRLATSARINADRITVRFGGYRDYSQAEYWIVPPGGEDPVSTPGERPVEEPEELSD